MQIILLVMVAALLVHDQIAAPSAAVLVVPSTLAWLAWWLAPLASLVIYALVCRTALRRIALGQGTVALRRVDRLGPWLRQLGLLTYLAALFGGVLDALRQQVGNWVLLDELLYMAPTLLLMLGMWYAYYPIDRRLRQALWMQRLDAGLPVYPIWTRGQYLLAQVRYQWLLIAAPLLPLMAWEETLRQLGPDGWQWLGASAQMVLTLLGVVGVYLLAPALILALWDTIPLPAGELREHLLAMVSRHKVRVRELLLWRTFGGIPNAAVLGFIGPLRYILMSDALLDRLTPAQVEAVMAHELAHIRHRHIPWLVVAVMGALEILGLISDALCTALLHLLGPDRVADWATGWFGPAATSDQVGVWLSMILTGIGWLLVFGWVSRRFERQADTFAVQHLAVTAAAPVQETIIIDPAAAQTMIGALQAVADLNHIPTRRGSWWPLSAGWRHGSIAWRQAYLATLVGRRCDELPIDRQVRVIKIVSLLALVAGIVFDLWWNGAGGAG